MRAIDADDLQKSLNDYVFNDPTCPMHIAAAVDQYIDFAPTIGGWIPCSERMPGINQAQLLQKIIGSKELTALEKRYLEELVKLETEGGECHVDTPHR